MRIVLAAWLLVLAGASGVRADVVRWINAAGGEWGVGANWSTGTVPGPGDVATLDLAGAYTVTIAGDHEVEALHVRNGDVTIVSSTVLRTISMNLSGAVRLQGGGYDFISMDQFVRCVIDCDPLIVESVVLRSNPPFAQLKACAELSGNIQAVNSSFIFRQVSVSGVVVGGGYGGYWAGFGPGTLTNANVSSTEGTHVQGPALVVDSSLSGGSDGGVRMSGEVSCLRTSISGMRRVLSGLTRLRTGSVVNPLNVSSLIENGASLFMEDGSQYNSRLEFGPGSTLRLEPGSVGPSPLSLWGDQNARLEFVIDATRTPAFEPRTVQYGEQLDGVWRVEVRNPNALRVGDEIVLLTSAWPFTNDFSQREIPDIGGGREVRLVTEQHRVLIRVLGVPGCWGPDFDGDGVDGTDADIEAFFACLAGDCCALCGSVDFDSDGDTATDADIEAFFRVLAGEAC